MAAIRIVLTDQNGERRRARIEGSAPISQIRDAVVAQRSLPMRDAQRRQVVYHLAFNGRQLQDNDTLESAGVTEDGTIQVLPEIVAGAISTPLVELLPDDDLEAQPAIPLLPHAPVRVSISNKALRAVERHASGSLFQEVGGVLMGTVAVHDNEYVVNVETHLRAKYTRATATSVTFTGRTWLDIIKRREAMPQTAMVGWYHSHPSYGVFLSTQDQFTHSSFFTDVPWKLAMVVDPCRHEWGFFVFADGRFERCSVVH